MNNISAEKSEKDRYITDYLFVVGVDLRCLTKKNMLLKVVQNVNLEIFALFVIIQPKF